jgi:hypothetical protein
MTQFSGNVKLNLSIHRIIKAFGLSVLYRRYVARTDLGAEANRPVVASFAGQMHRKQYGKD